MYCNYSVGKWEGRCVLLEDDEEVHVPLAARRLVSWLASVVCERPAKEPFLVYSWMQGLGCHTCLYCTGQLHCFYKCEKQMFDRLWMKCYRFFLNMKTALKQCDFGGFTFIVYLTCLTDVNKTQGKPNTSSREWVLPIQLLLGEHSIFTASMNCVLVSWENNTDFLMAVELKSLQSVLVQHFDTNIILYICYFLVDYQLEWVPLSFCVGGPSPGEVCS